MSIRHLSRIVLAALLAPITASGQTPGQLTDAPRMLAYSAPLLKGARQASMDMDSTGRIYLAGYICEPTLPVTPNAAQPAYAGGCDGFVAILSPDHRLQYATYLGGTGQERISVIRADGAGNVYVAGDTGSANFPTTAGAYDTTFEPNGLDVFVTKLTPAGAIGYSTFLGGTGYEFALGLAVDGSGRAHVVGNTDSPDFPTTPGALSQTHPGAADGFYTRIEADASSVSYSTYVGGSGADGAVGVVLDAAGVAYVAGSTESGDLPVIGAVQPSNGGSADAWLMKVGTDGSIKYLTYFGGTGIDSPVDMTMQGGSVFLLGNTCSPDLPSAPSRDATCNAAFVARLAADGTAVTRTTIIEAMTAYAFGVDVRNRAFVVGYTQPSFRPTPDAFQSTSDSLGSPTLAVMDLDSPTAAVEYASYFGAAGPLPHTVLIDGAGGVVIGAQFINNEGHERFPIVNAPFASVPAGGAVLHFVPESRWVANVHGEIVLYAEDVTTIRGNWRLEEDSTAALGRKLRNPNLGMAKLSAALSAPADYVEFQFHAEAGVSYHLWMRGRADADNWANDSVFVQFSDSVDTSGAPAARIGSTSAMAVNLEDCTNCGIKGWGWQDNGYGANVLGTAVRFTTTGVHTVRVQRREDGYAFDQLVLSASRFRTTSPGPLKQASTVLARSNGQPATAAEVVLHMTNAQTHGSWTKEARSDAASATVVRSPNAGAAKMVTVPVPAVNYFELRFDADAGRPYHLWIRGIALSDYWGNDSVHVQFSDSIDISGAPRWRIGTAASTEVNLEDCSGCGLRGWGWQDNGWGAGVSGPLIYFASSGTHVIRVTTREDGFSIDQIVLSSSRYLTASPGALKNDSVILAKTQ